MDNADQIRASILGVLIKDARIHAGRSIAESAQALGLASEEFEQIEKGEAFPDMPFLEALAMYLHVPFEQFWGEQTLGGYPVGDFEELIAKRRGSIGNQIKTLRENAGKSVEDLAKAMKIETEELVQIESGETSVSISMAEKIARALSISVKELQEDASDNALHLHEQEQKLLRQIREMPEEMRAFVVKPINQPYLAMAMKLSHMEVNRMRDFAEDILEITL